MKRFVVLVALAGGLPVAAPAQRTLATPSIRLPALPAPVLRHIGQETYQSGGSSWTRQTYEITNRTAYPAAFWTPAPTLPPCGSNANASRAWVDIFTESGQRLYGYCAATSADEFRVFGFQKPAGAAFPPRVYVIITDRQTGRTWKSNLAEGGGAAPPEIH